MRHSSFSRAGALRATFFEKTFLDIVCVTNFRSVAFFVWPGGVTQTHTHIYTSTNKNILERLLASHEF